MPGQQPENYRRSKLRRGLPGPQGSGLEPSRRRAGRAYKGSDSLHLSVGEIRAIQRRLKGRTSLGRKR